MAFKYDNLWTMLKEQNMTRDELRFKIGASQSTIVKMGRDETVSLDVINRICSVLKCTPSDFLEFVPEGEFIPQEKLVKRGDVFTFGISNLVDEVEHLRPILVLQNDFFNENSKTIIAVPLNSRIPQIIRQTDIVVKANEINGLSFDSIIMIEQINSFRKQSIKEKIGVLEADLMQKVNKACLNLFDL